MGSLFRSGRKNGSPILPITRHKVLQSSSSLSSVLKSDFFANFRSRQRLKYGLLGFCVISFVFYAGMLFGAQFFSGLQPTNVEMPIHYRTHAESGLVGDSFPQGSFTSSDAPSQRVADVGSLMDLSKEATDADAARTEAMAKELRADAEALAVDAHAVADGTFPGVRDAAQWLVLLYVVFFFLSQKTYGTRSRWQLGTPVAISRIKGETGFA